MASNKYTTIGFIGLGVMGYPMCENLIKKVPETTKFYVYDVIEDALKRISESHPKQVTVCGSSKEVAERSEMIISMVPEGSHVRSVYLTPDTGVLAADVSGKLLIDCSTIDTTTSLQVLEETKKQDPTTSFFDAPVSGGELGAKKGTLTFMVGCKEDDPEFPVLQHLLGMMGASIVACGGPSLGLTAKLCHNYCSAMIAIANSEALNIGMKAGMDPRVLANVFHNSVAQSTVCDKWCPVPGVVPGCPASNGYRGGFRVALMRKDVGLAVDTAKRVGAKLALGDSGWQCYKDAADDPKCQGLDSRVVYRFLGGDENWDGKQAEREA